MSEWIDRTVGKVRIERELARGGMAEVYLGMHLTLDRPVAVKVMHNYVESDPELKARFEREAKVVAALRHPNIVQIFDFDTADGHPYIVMEYLRGPSLAAYLRKVHERGERLQPAQVSRLLVKISAALDYAHEQGVIHRDVKPGNIILHDRLKDVTLERPITEQTDPVLTDFGLVRIVQSATQTASGVVSGTPAYMSPEQAQGLKVDHRTDIYSLGVMLYEMLAGRVPFESDTSWTLILKHINEPPPPIPGIQPAVQRVIDRALAKDPEMRYQSCREMVEEYLEAIGVVSDASTVKMTTSSPSVSMPTGTASLTKPEAGSVSKNRDPLPASTRKRFLPIVFAGIAVMALVAFGVFRLLPSDQQAAPPTAMEHGADTHAIEENTTPIAAPETELQSVGLLRFQDGTSRADQVTVTTPGMQPPSEGTQYEVWLIEDDGETLFSIGVLNFDSDGKGTLNYVDEQGRNLIGIYSAVEITVEPSPDNNPNPSNDIGFKFVLPPSGYSHVRHLLHSFPTTPGQIGFIEGLDHDTKLLEESARQMLTFFEAGDNLNARLEAEKMLNLIVGNQSEDYRDWDGNGTTDDPGDGFGLLLNGGNTGYIQGTFTHANLSITSEDATQNMLDHGEHVKIAAQNLDLWTPQLRDRLIAIVEAPADADIETDLREAVVLANKIRNGIDVNGNENIEAITGEGGAITAYQHAYYLADMSILPRMDQPPVP